VRVRSEVSAASTAQRALGTLLGLVFLAGGLALGGCGSASGGLHADTQAMLAATVPAPAAERADAEPAVPVVPTPIAADEATPSADAEPSAASATAAALELLPMEPITDAQMTPYLLALADRMTIAQSDREAGPPLEPPVEEYDPWESFNEKMFTFNYNLDKHVLKPVAKGYNFVVPDELQRMIDRGFINITFVPRFVNNLLQAKWSGAGRELARFLINSTVGIGGLWDMAKQEFGIEPSKEDFGQTLGVWGVGPGPFLVLPFMAPMTVRDGIGLGVDTAMDPLSYYIPFIWERLVMRVVNMVNDRALNLEVFEGVEETTVDLYTAVRNAYLQRRARQIRE
jgi:phospholipid-binding lipoprotein MlaA